MTIGDKVKIKQYSTEQIVTFMGFQLINEIEVERKGDLDIQTTQRLAQYMLYLDDPSGNLEYAEVDYKFKWSSDLSKKL